MADAAVTRSLERMLKDAQGKKYHNLQNALKAYLDRRKDPEGQAVGSSDTAPKDAITGEKHNDDQSASLEELPSHFKQENSSGASQTTAATMTEIGHTLEGPEADLIWHPLKLALETNQPKLVEPALDCLHKLISYGHLEGDAGLHNGKNTVMLTDILNKVCSCADNSASDNTVLQVIKVILTTVASTKFQVHGECLLTAIRTCYNIVLNSKSPVNQATAKATLTQMVSIVFKRMESDTQVCEDNTAGNSVLDSKESLSMETPSSQIGEACKDSMEGEAQEDAGQSTVTVEELQHLAGDADIKGLEAVLDKAVHSVGGTKTKEGLDLESLSVGESDALLVFRTISKMSMKEGNDDMIIRTKNLSLELLQGLLETVSHSFTVNYAFLDSVKTYLCSALLRSCVSNNAAVFQLACRIFLILLSRFRESLKAEIGVFFPLIVLRSLDSGETSLPQRTAVLRMLEKVCLDSQMLADIFVNYDCNLEATNLFERMVSSLSRMAQGTPNADPNSIALSQNIALKGSALQCLVNVLRSLVTWTKMHDEVKQRPYNRDAWEGGQSEGSLVDASKEVTQADEFGKVKAQKITLEAAISEFNRRPSKGIELLVSNKLVSAEPVAVAQFLKSTPGLDKAMVGDYLGQHEEFQISVMHAFVNSMNFQDMKFDLAIREFLKGFRLPGEAQKIDRIMEKFAERYCHDNPGLFKNADTAYVLAYAIILLNTDAHNPMVWPKMSKSEFVRMNSGTESEEQAPQQLLEEIYDSIVKDEIKMKDDNGRKKLDSEEKGRLVTVLNLGFSRRKSNADAKQEHEDIIRRTQALFRKGGVKRGVFYRATHVELARPMLEAVGWPLLAAFSVTMEDSDNKPRVSLCMEGFRCGIHLTEVLGMDTMRYAFLTSLIRFTFLHAPKEMRGKNVEVLKTLLALSENEPNALRDTWNAVLECISRLEYITSSPTILATLMYGSNQISRDALAQSLIELTGKPIEQVFVNSSKFPSDVIVEFFTALCGVSAEELKQNPPRVFSLQKLVEISYYNMARIRMVWGRIWLVLSQHFVSAGSHQDEKIAMYAIDSLRQLGMKYLERVELANFTFQNDILKPFVVLMRNSRRAVIRGLIVDCIVQMIKSKVGNIRSGWKSVFMIFTTAAFDDTESIADLAFESVEQVVLEHFDQVAGDCFMDCVNCLIAFANNKISSRTSLKSIALLRICEDRLAEGYVPGGDSKCVETIGSGVDLDVAEYYWFPMLAGLSDLTSDPRLEVRNCALEVLFDLLNERGHKFSASFWESVFHRVLFPIFDYVRHAGKDGEKTASADQWLRETCIHSLQLLCDLFSNFYKEVSFLLPSLLGLLLDCATRPDQALASISVGALVRLTEVGGHQFTEKDWSTLLESINNVCYTTQPVELLNPEHAFGYTSDYASKKMVVGTLPIKSHQAAEGAYSDVESLENDESGVGTPTSSSNGVVSKSSQRLSLDTRDGDYQETEVSSLSPLKDNKHTSNGPASKGLSSRGFMGNMMDTLLLKNLTFKSKNVSGDMPMPTPPKEHDMEDENQLEPEEDNPLLQSIRSKCLIQLLLLGAIDSLQRKHWLLLKASHKILIMDTLLSMVDFASSYNSDASLRFRMQQFSGERPPPNLLRQEIEATQLYLSVLTRAASFIDGNDSKHAEHDLVDQEYKAVSGEEDKLREEAERRLITFFSHILKDAVNLEAGAGEVVQAEAHRSLSLRSSVIVKVLNAMSKLDTKIFKRHLSEFYPYFTKLICSSQMDVRRALGDLFKSRLVALLP